MDTLYHIQGEIQAFIGERLKALRKEKNLTLRALANKSNISSFSYIRNIEEGIVKDPSISTVVKLAKALEVSIDELVGNRTN